MTDNEIKKALKEILETMLVMGDLQTSSTISRALALFNRLQAEKEGLQKLMNLSIDTQNDLTDKLLQAEENLKTAKTEAYKEFAEELKECAFTVNQFEEVLYKEDIDNLLKEKVGDTNV